MKKILLPLFALLVFGIAQAETWWMEQDKPLAVQSNVACDSIRITVYDSGTAMHEDTTLKYTSANLISGSQYLYTGAAYSFSSGWIGAYHISYNLFAGGVLKGSAWEVIYGAWYDSMRASGFAEPGDAMTLTTGERQAIEDTIANHASTYKADVSTKMDKGDSLTCQAKGFLTNDDTLACQAKGFLTQTDTTACQAKGFLTPSDTIAYVDSIIEEFAASITEADKNEIAGRSAESTWTWQGDVTLKDTTKLQGSASGLTAAEVAHATAETLEHADHNFARDATKDNYKADVSNLDTTISSRLDTTDYTAPDNQGIADLKDSTHAIRVDMVKAQDSLDVLTAGLNIAQDSLNVLLANLATAQGSLNVLTAGLVTVQGSTNVVLTNLATLDIKADKLQDSLDAAIVYVGVAQGSLDVALTNIATAQESINTVEANLATLKLWTSWNRDFGFSGYPADTGWIWYSTDSVGVIHYYNASDSSLDSQRVIE